MWEWTGLILVISHTYECNTDISLLIFIDKSWPMQNMGTIDWSLPLPIPPVLTFSIYKPAAIVRSALILQNTGSLLFMGHNQYQLTCRFYLAVMYGDIFNKCVCLWGFIFVYFFSCWFFLVGFFVWFFGWGCLGLFLYIFSLFSVDSIFFELLKICRPQIAFYSTKMPNPVP